MRDDRLEKFSGQGEWDEHISTSIYDNGTVLFFDTRDGWACISISAETMDELIKRYKERF